MKKCEHQNKRLIKTDKGGIFIEASWWCRDCGAIKTASRWILPSYMEYFLELRRPIYK